MMKIKALALLAVLSGQGWAGEALRLGTAGGTAVAPLDLGGHKATVLIFFLHDCPVCNAYAPELERLKSAYALKGLQFFLIQTDPDLDAAAAAEHAREYGLTMTVVLDPENKLAAIAHAHTTPEAVVIGAGEKVLYRGRIDDLFADIGKRRPQATTHDLRNALDAILAGLPAPPAGGPAVGCSIPGMDDNVNLKTGKKAP